MALPRLATALVLVMAASGCDLPTSVPTWETEWELLLARDSVPLREVLPPDVELAPGGLRVASFVTRDSVRLEEVCELCTCFEGPIPELALEPRDYRLELPSRLVEAPLLRGRARLELTNRLGFDLLDDGSGGRGFVRADMIDLRTRDTLVTRSWADSFPEGTTVALDFPLDGVLLSRSIVVRVTGTTPGSRCEDLTLDPTDGLDVRIELRDVEAPSARIVLNEADLAPPTRRAGLPREISTRLRPAESDLVVELAASSTLDLAVDLELSVAASTGELHGAGAALTTPVRLEPGAPGDPFVLRRAFVVDPSLLQDRDSLVVAGLTRLSRGTSVTVTGAEQLVYEVRLQARIPSR